MPQRVRSDRAAFNARPFEGQGVSVYASVGTTVQYRALRCYNGRARGAHRRRITVKGSAGQPFVRKTSRVASEASPATEAEWTLPAAYLGETVTFDVRTFRDDCENESDNFRAVTVAVDSGGDDETGILGTAILLDQEPRAGGIVRLRFAWSAARDGVQPDLFKILRTAGPSSPADQTTAVIPRQRIYEIDTPALLDSAPYTYTIRAQNTAGTITADLVTGISVQADATGPTTPTSATAEPW